MSLDHFFDKTKEKEKGSKSEEKSPSNNEVTEKQRSGAFPPIPSVLSIWING